ncbi:hypothetical protein ACFL6X_03025 [Candidatus Latescibacterota bacterium]
MPARVYLAVLCLLATSRAWPTETDRTAFPDGSEAGEAESKLADASDGASAAVRWRLRGPAGEMKEIRLYERAEWSPSPHLTGFLLAERDPGERRWSDFVSAYSDWRGTRGRLTVGNLRPGLGQGVVYSRTGARGGIPSASARRDQDRVGFRSATENAAVQGLWGSVRRRGFTAAGLAGRLEWDGRVADSGAITSLPESGLHTSLSELAARDQLRGRVMGGRLSWSTDTRGGGLHWLHLRLLRTLDLRRPDRVAHAFHGSRLSLLGGDVHCLGRGWRLYGEAAVDGEGKCAAVAGARMSGGLRIAVQGRRYPPGWWSPLGGSATASGMDNETGVQLEAKGSRWRAYIDQVRRPQPTYHQPLSRPSCAWGLELERSLTSTWTTRAAFQVKRDSDWSQGVLGRERSTRVRLEADRGRRQGVRLRAEARRVSSGSDGQIGLLLSSRWRGQAGILRWGLHGTRFSIPSYASRIYEYEQEVPGAVSIRALYGDGWRVYGMVSVCTGAAELHLRYRYEDVTGRAAKAELALQLDLMMGP